jgi:excisionase family DNA binding protein
MTVKQLAEYLQMNEHTIYKLARSGKIPSIKIAGQWRFKKDIIDKWIDEKSMERIKKSKNDI